MKLVTLSLTMVLALGGCMEVTNSGVGTAANGDPVSGSMTYNSAGTAGTFKLTNLNGRICTGNATFSSADVSTFPLQCDSGISGTAISTINRFGHQQTISFKLSNGETGSVTLGRV